METGDSLIRRIVSEALSERLVEKNRVDEGMRFPVGRFIGELAMLMRKYKVNLVGDGETCGIEDGYGNTVLDFKGRTLTPDNVMRMASRIGNK